MELKVARGKGYVTALDNKESFDLPVGWIYIDTLF
jgi:DNA-directed RNA polymerase subunit alpha